MLKDDSRLALYYKQITFYIMHLVSYNTFYMSVIKIHLKICSKQIYI